MATFADRATVSTPIYHLRTLANSDQVAQALRKMHDSGGPSPAYYELVRLQTSIESFKRRLKAGG